MGTVGEANASGLLRLRVCWVLFVVFLALSIGATAWPKSALPSLAALPLPFILVIHGSLLYGWRGIGLYFAIGLPVGFAFEASSIANGFPFGHFVHNVDIYKPAGVSPLALISYAFLGWIAWTLAKVIALDRPDRNQPLSRITVPLVAAFILPGIDVPMDPIGATVDRNWTYTYPSGLFGVPLTNFLGWLLTGWVLFQLFALIERRFTATAASRTRAYWLLPCLMWFSMTIQLPFNWIRAAAGTASVGGRAFVIADIYEAAVITALFTMVPVVLFALVRLFSRAGGWPASDS